MSKLENPTPRTETQAKTTSLDRALDLLQRREVRFVSLQFIDVLGTVKSITIPAERFAHAVQKGEWFDGSSVEGFARIFESDMYVRPDLSTLAIAGPATGGTAQVICDIVTPDGQRFAGDPRGVLARALADAAEMSFAYSVATELEFFLLKPEDGGPLRPLPHDSASYFDHALDLGSEVRQEMVTALVPLGIAVETSHHEVAPGQHELDLGPLDAMRAADQLVTLKYTVRAIAARRGLHATFMPKPIFGVTGSGMHVHQVLTSASPDANAFYDRGDEYHLSPTAKHFIAGQLAHARSLCAVVAPVVNSYKRLVPGFEAPVAITWAQLNRSALIRVPRISEDDRAATRVEFRAPDPSCNPYLAFAVMLRAGLDGIRQKLPLPPAVEENLYAFDPERLSRMRVGLLPQSLNEALVDLRHDEVMRDTLGAHLLERFIETKEMEWDAYQKQVTPWELEAYLDSY